MNAAGLLPHALPVSRVPHPHNAPTLRWGILGTGWIADQFVRSLHRNTGQHVVAVGSRTQETAARFASAHGIVRAHSSYESLTQDPDVDIIYVASPHHLHVEHGLLAMSAGKHVLIEKPMALTLAGLERLHSAADRHGVLCQEAFWSFFLPKFDVMRQILDDGWLGPLTSILADHGEWLPPEHRIHSPALAGGSLHDLGVYVFALISWAAGAPAEVKATGSMTPTGVIGDVGVAMITENGAMGSLATTMTATTPCRATLAGSLATMTTQDAFFFPGPFIVSDPTSRQVLVWDEPNVRHDALHFEATEVARCIGRGELSALAWTREHSRNVVLTLQAVNAQLGLSPKDA